MSKIEEDKIYKMKLHDELFPNTEALTRIVRVAGGWIYIFYGDGGACTSVFVPYNNEF